MSNNQHSSESSTGFLEETEIKEPSMYKVIMLNDNFTSMEFVVEILMRVFRKSAEEATSIMLDIHRGGFGECGTYTYDIAQTKVIQVKNAAKQNGFPLRCRIEEA